MGSAYFRRLHTNPGTRIVHYSEDVSVPLVLIQVIVPQRSVCSDMDVFQVDNFARPDALHLLPKRTRLFLPFFEIDALATLLDELGYVLLHAKSTAVFRQPVQGSHGTTVANLVLVSTHH